MTYYDVSSRESTIKFNWGLQYKRNYENSADHVQLVNKNFQAFYYLWKFNHQGPKEKK